MTEAGRAMIEAARRAASERIIRARLRREHARRRRETRRYQRAHRRAGSQVDY
jgi:hypothetical protein